MNAYRHHTTRVVVGSEAYHVCRACGAQVPDPDADCPVALRKVLDPTIRNLREKRQREEHYAATFCTCPLGKRHEEAAKMGRRPDAVPTFGCGRCNGSGYVWRYVVPDFASRLPREPREKYIPPPRAPSVGLTCAGCGHHYSGPKGTPCPLAEFHPQGEAS